ncbi:MAG: hypothetical protein PWQ70_3176 [Clostridiales bacterium]|nr:hypothetical protein [Clostridiales bacterium]
MIKDKDFSVNDLERIIFAGEEKAKKVKKPVVAEEIDLLDGEFDEDRDVDIEKVFEGILEQVILESDIIDVIRSSTFEEAGIMSNNKGLVIEVAGLEDLNTGKVYDGPFEFQLTITHR